MDEFLDLVKNLELPQKGNTHLEELRRKVFGLWEDAELTPTQMINELKGRIENMANTMQDNNELPFLYFLRAHCFNVEAEFSGNQNPEPARRNIEMAVHKFGVYNIEWNEALAHCYLGLLHYRAGDFDACHNELTIATKILTRLGRDYARTKDYDRLQKIKSQIDKITDQIKRAEAPYKNSGNLEDNAFQSEVAVHRLILQNHRKRLSQYYNNLRRNHQRVPPTLVASLFYLYKKLAPSHSVYFEIPKPATERERTLYKELLSKVGFFEVIEQLIALEQEFHLTASREELLDIVNQEWDKDIRQ